MPVTINLQTWLEEKDIESRLFNGRTWVPLLEMHETLKTGTPWRSGFRKEYQSIECLIVPVEHRATFAKATWQTVSKTNSHRAWADENAFQSPASYYGENGEHLALYPVLRQNFDTEEASLWHPLQELEIGLGLLRQGDVWTRPDEDNIDVLRLERDVEGQPVAMQIRAEFLRDYLCAKKAALLLTGFLYREAVEELSLGLDWSNDRCGRKFPRGYWEGYQSQVHEGGQPVGMTTHVIRVWRESVNPQDDVPIIPKPHQDPGLQSESFDVAARGKILQRAEGSIWWTEWIEPGAKSPRIAFDEVESRVPFIIENQEQGMLNGKALREYGGWLWFRPSVVRDLLQKHRACFRWCSQCTGEIGPVSNQGVHFGINNIGLLNVRAKDIGHLDEWAQKIWAKHNVTPEGGLSDELHQAQNLAIPAKTLAAEVALMSSVKFLQQVCLEQYGNGFFRTSPNPVVLGQRIHRFYTESFEEVCLLCKELSRCFTEQINTELLDKSLDPAGAGEAKKKGFRPIKRIELWLNHEGRDGRSITTPLVGINELRQADAHSKGSPREPLQLFGIPEDAEDYQAIALKIIADTVNCFSESGKTVSEMLSKQNSESVS